MHAKVRFVERLLGSRRRVGRRGIEHEEPDEARRMTCDRARHRRSSPGTLAISAARRRRGGRARRPTVRELFRRSRRVPSKRLRRPSSADCSVARWRWRPSVAKNCSEKKWQWASLISTRYSATVGRTTVPSMGPFMRFEMAVSTPSSTMPAISRYHQKFWRRS